MNTDTAHKCSSCEHHRSKSSKTTGKLIPSYHGKCTRPDGPCLAVLYSTPEQELNSWNEEVVHTIPASAPATMTEAQVVEVQNTSALVDQAVLDAESIHKAIGRIEGLEFLRRVGDVAVAQIFSEVRKSKNYKGLPYHDEEGNLRHVEDFDEFCRVKLGKSYTRCYELSQNLHTLGPDLYESAERIGFRARDYRALKALPPEEQEIVKEALASESKEQVVDLLQDMAERHKAERDASKKEREELQADMEARDKLLKSKTDKLDEAALELERFKSLPPAMNVELKLAREKEAIEKLGIAHIEFLSHTNGFYQHIANILAAEEVSAHTKEHAVWTVRQTCEEIVDFLAKHGIQVDFQHIIYPEWALEKAQADLENGETEEPSGAHGAW